MQSKIRTDIKLLDIISECVNRGYVGFISLA